jgi:predicted metalloendopeptidase
MIARIEAAFADNIRALDWMDEVTKAAALVKLNAIGNACQ